MIQAKRTVITLLIAATIGPMAGCRICSDCEDLAYPAYGGAWQRTSRESGRVGSIFDPGGARAAELVSRDEPDSPDVIQRRLQGERYGDENDPDEDRDAESSDGSFDIPKLDDLRDRKLDDIENDAEDKIRGKSLDDIEVRIIPGRKPTVVTTR